MLKETMLKRGLPRMHMLRKTIMRVSILHRSMEEIMLKTVIRRIHMIRKAIMKASILQRSMLRVMFKTPILRMSTTKTMPEVSERAALKVRITPRMMQVKMI